MVGVAGLRAPCAAPGFTGVRVQSARRTAFRAVRTTTVAASPEYQRRAGDDRGTAASNCVMGWLPKNPLVVGAGIAGWVIPSNIPVSALGGASLFGKFTQSIGQELSHFPTGPALQSPFWLYLVTWHVGLFLTLFLGQIGVQARKQGYLD